MDIFLLSVPRFINMVVNVLKRNRYIRVIPWWRSTGRLGLTYTVLCKKYITMRINCIVQGTLLTWWPKWEWNPNKWGYMYTMYTCSWFALLSWKQKLTQHCATTLQLKTTKKMNNPTSGWKISTRNFPADRKKSAGQNRWQMVWYILWNEMKLVFVYICV